MNQDNLIMILLTILAIAVIFAMAAAVIAAMWILLHAKAEVAVIFMVISLIALISVLIYRYSK